MLHVHGLVQLIIMQQNHGVSLLASRRSVHHLLCLTLQRSPMPCCLDRWPIEPNVRAAIALPSSSPDADGRDESMPCPSPFSCDLFGYWNTYQFTAAGRAIM